VALFSTPPLTTSWPELSIDADDTLPPPATSNSVPELIVYWLVVDVVTVIVVMVVRPQVLAVGVLSGEGSDQ
jgi:hypothetical protein